eukprot:3643503-Rhodomonas_salina.2
MLIPAVVPCSSAAQAADSTGEYPPLGTALLPPYAPDRRCPVLAQQMCGTGIANHTTSALREVRTEVPYHATRSAVLIDRMLLQLNKALAPLLPKQQQ